MLFNASLARRTVLVTLLAVTVSACSSVLRNPLPADVYEEATPVAPDTLLSTAGTNGFPPGLQVAMVTGAIEPIGDQITDGRVTPVADFSRLPRFVAIVQYQPSGTVDEETPEETVADTAAVSEEDGADAGTEGTTP